MTTEATTTAVDFINSKLGTVIVFPTISIVVSTISKLTTKTAALGRNARQELAKPETFAFGPDIIVGSALAVFFEGIKQQQQGADWMIIAGAAMLVFLWFQSILTGWYGCKPSGEITIIGCIIQLIVSSLSCAVTYSLMQ